MPKLRLSRRRLPSYTSARRFEIREIGGDRPNNKEGLAHRRITSGKPEVFLLVSVVQTNDWGKLRRFLEMLCLLTLLNICDKIER